jgi:hypothetical protein
MIEDMVFYVMFLVLFVVQVSVAWMLWKCFKGNDEKLLKIMKNLNIEK